MAAPRRQREGHVIELGRAFHEYGLEMLGAKQIQCPARFIDQGNAGNARGRQHGAQHGAGIALGAHDQNARRSEIRLCHATSKESPILALLALKAGKG